MVRYIISVTFKDMASIFEMDKLNAKLSEVSGTEFFISEQVLSKCLYGKFYGKDGVSGEELFDLTQVPEPSFKNSQDGLNYTKNYIFKNTGSVEYLVSFKKDPNLSSGISVLKE